MEAVDFRIEVGDPVPGGYRLTIRGEDDVFRGVAGLDIAADPVLQTKLSYLRIVLQSSSAPSRAVTSAEEQDVQYIGARLFRHLLVDEAMGMLARARRVARESGREVRITLRIRPPELAALPWEFMYDARPDRNEYLARQCLVVRDAEDAAPTPPLRVAGPLRMLAMVADVADLPRLDAAAERGRLERALGGLTGSGRLEVHWAEATKSALVGALRQGPWHVFHYIGHGEYDARSQEGRLAFADQAGRPDFVTAGQLAATLGSHPALRLAVLNACETGAGGPDPHSSVAAALIHGGLPAVVGMQYPITDLVAPVFSQAFYEALADGAAVDRCVQAGRMAIWLGHAASLEWGTPVLYQRSADGRVFDVGAADPVVEAAETPGMAPRGEVAGPTVVAPPKPAMFDASRQLRKILSQAGRATTNPPEKRTAPDARVVRVVTLGAVPLALAFSPDESSLAVLSEAWKVHVARLRDSTADWSAPATANSRTPALLRPTSVYFDPSRRRLHAICHSIFNEAFGVGGWLKREDAAFDFRWSTRTKEYIDHDSGVFVVVHDPAAGPQPLRVVAGADTCRVERGSVVYEPGSGTKLLGVRYAALSRKHAAVVNGDGEVFIWETATGRLVRTLATDKAAGPVAFTADGRQIIHNVNRPPRLITMTDVVYGTPSNKLWAVSEPAAWAFHRIGLLFCRSGEVGHLSLLRSDKVLTRLPWPTTPAPTLSPVFSESGRYLAFPSSDTTVTVWDISDYLHKSSPSSAPSSPGA